MASRGEHQRPASVEGGRKVGRSRRGDDPKKDKVGYAELCRRSDLVSREEDAGAGDEVVQLTLTKLRKE